MKKPFYVAILSLLSLSYFSQTNTHEAVNLRPQKVSTASNPNLVYLDATKTFDLPADGGFLYSSLNGEMGGMSSGYNNNEDYTLTILNQYDRTIFLRSQYLFLENTDVLEIYDGADVNAPLIRSVSGILDKNFLIQSTGTSLTLHFKSDNSGTSRGFRFRMDNGPGTNNRPAAPLPSPMACASTPASNECVNAPLICDLNGYCGNTSSAYTAGNTSGLGNFCGSIENNSWLSFVASGTSASLGFNSGGCQDNSAGIQAVIYASSNCTSFTEVSNCESQGNGSGTFTITTNVNLVPGQTYYVMVDGFAGNVCNYTVTAQAGVALGQQISGPSQMCPGTSATLGATSSASSYAWTSNPAGVYPNTQTITITPTVTTTYTLTMGPSACTPTGITIVKTVTVTNTLNPANITAPNPICMGTNITLASLTNGGTYTWTGPNTFTSNVQNPTINNWSTANNGVYTLVINYGPGCATAPATINLTGTPSPTINITAAPSLTVCSGQSVVLTATGGTGTNGYTWNWNPTQTSASTQFCTIIPGVPAVLNPITGAVIIAAIPASTNCIGGFPIPGLAAYGTATFTPNQTTQICSSSENAAGCTGSRCVTITVLPAAAGLTVTPLTSTICPGQSSTLTVSGGTTYTWSPSATLSSPNGSVVTANPAITTVYTVSTTVCGGTIVTRTVQVTVSPPLSVTVTPNSTSICTGSSTTLTASGATSYTWSPAATLSSANGTAVTATPLTTTTYTVIGATGTCTGSTTAVVNINPGLTLTVTPASANICPGATTTLTVTGATNYTWSPSATLSSPNGSVVTANPVTATTYTVIGATGTCTGSATASVLMNGSLTLTVTPITSTVCPGGSTILTATGATNYTWSPAGSLSSANGSTVTATPGSTTTYTVIGATGTCTGSATANVSIGAALTLTLSSNTPTVCPGGSALLDANGATSYTWSPAGTLSSANGSNVTATPLANTIYTVVGSTGGCTGTSTISVNIGVCVSSGCNLSAIRSALTSAGNIELLGMNNTCSLYFINPQFMTGPQAQAYAQSFGANLISVQSATENADLVQALSNQGYSAEVVWIGFSDAVTEGSYVWYDGSPISYTNWAPTEPNDAGGVEDCTQIYPDGTWNDLNCAGYNSLSVIEINLCPQVTVTTPTIHCPGTNVTLNASTLLGSPGYTYTWVQSGTETFTNTSAPGNTDQITVTSMGANTFTVYSEDRYSCPQFAITTLSVNPSPTITANSATICAGSSATLTANGATTYSWIPGTGLSSTTGSVVTSTPGSTQSYTVIGMDGNGCLNGTITAVTVNPLPVVAASPNVTICPATSATLTASGATSYTWSPSATLSSANDATVIASPTVGTTYTVSGSSGGCTGTASVSVYVSGNGFLPNVYIIQKNSVCDTSILNWVNVTSVTPTLAQGTLPNGITVSATHSNGGLSTTPGMFGGASFPVTYSVPIASTTIRNDLGGTFNFCFSQPVINPQIAFSSIGTTGVPITVNTSVPYQIVWSGISMTYVSSTSMIGEEGYTIIRFPGIHTCVSLDYIGNESYCNMAFGVMDMACQNQPICPNAPIQLIGNGATSYTWNTGATTSTLTPTPSVTTTYSVSGINADGCANTATSTVVVHPTPTITVNSSTICVGQQTATLTANGADTYTWSPSATLSSNTGSVVTGTPLASQNYTVTGTDVNGCVNDTTTTITVNPLPVITASSASICVGQQTATLTANGATTYSWIPGTGLSSTTASVVTGTPGATQNYTVVGMDANGCLNGTITSIFVHSLPTITVNSSTICLGQQTATLTANGASTYSWSPATGLNVTSGAAVTGTPGATQDYTITGTDINGCYSDGTSTITVNATPTITVNSATICLGQQTATLTANGADTYTWSPGTGLSSINGATVTGTPVATENYTITGTDVNGCYGSNTSTITVNPIPTVTVADTTICPGSSATLNASGATNYTWTPNQFLNTAFNGTVISTPSVTTSYTIDAETLGCITTASVTVTVSNTVVVNASASTSTICPLASSSLSATGATSYTWTPAITLNTNTGGTVVATPSANETYTVIGATGTCTNSAQVVITVTVNPTITVGNVSPICSASGTAALAANGASTYTWSPNTALSATVGANVNANPSTTQTYTVNGTSPLGCNNFTTVVVTVVPTPTITTTANPLTICDGSVTTLSAFGATNYTWSPSADLSSANGSPVQASPSISTIFTVNGSNGIGSDPDLCTSSNTIAVTVLPKTPAIPGPVDPICFGASTTVYATGGNTYQWQPTIGVTNPNDSTTFVSPLSTTVYTVTVSRNGLCPTTATIEVVVNPLPIIDAGRDTTINIDEVYVLHGTGNVDVGFLSPDGNPLICNFCPVLEVAPDESTCYTLKGQNTFGCVATDVICIEVTRDWNVYIPNAFTPNGDVNNDVFIPVGYGLEEIKLTIFDRWGSVVFVSNGDKIGWDGNSKTGKPCEQNVYVYLAEIKTMAGNIVKRTGHVTLLSRVK